MLARRRFLHQSAIRLLLRIGVPLHTPTERSPCLKDFADNVCHIANLYRHEKLDRTMVATGYPFLKCSGASLNCKW